MSTIATLEELENEAAHAAADLVPRRALDLADPQETLTPSHTNKDVTGYFRDHPEAPSVVVVEGGIPIGLINRSIFLGGFSQPFHREVYERKSCIAFMDKSPLVVDGELSVDELGRLAVEAGGKVLTDGFIVTRSGRYHGHSTGIRLLKALGQLEAERNRVIRESIDYAHIIQGSVLATSIRALSTGGLADQHLLWEPRDTVGGDAFFARRCEREGRKSLFLALMDCTGHGVPGAFTAMLMTSFLGNVLDRVEPWEPGHVLAEVNRRVKDELGQHHRPEDALPSVEERTMQADEGMDALCLWVEPETGICAFAGARNSLWVLRPGSLDLEEIKGDRAGVGYVGTLDDQAWDTTRLRFETGTLLFGLSDGLVDQIGGPKRIAFGKRRLWEAVLAGHPDRDLRGSIQGALAAMKSYQGAEKRRDDISMLGIRLGGTHAA